MALPPITRGYRGPSAGVEIDRGCADATWLLSADSQRPFRRALHVGLRLDSDPLSIAARLVGLVSAAALIAGCGAASSATAAASPAAAPSPGIRCAAPSPRPSGGGGFERPVASGTVTSVGSGSLTVQDRTSGGPVQVTYDSSTTIPSGGQAGTAADIQAGAQVSVQGQRQADGSVTATSITVRPAGAGPPGAGSPGPGASPRPGGRRGCPSPTSTN